MQDSKYTQRKEVKKKPKQFLYYDKICAWTQHKARIKRSIFRYTLINAKQKRELMLITTTVSNLITKEILTISLLGMIH